MLDTNATKVELELKLLKRIANYYEFPLAVFFGNEKLFKNKKTRNISLMNEIKDKLDDLYAIFQDLEQTYLYE